MDLAIAAPRAPGRCPCPAAAIRAVSWSYQVRSWVWRGSEGWAKVIIVAVLLMSGILHSMIQKRSPRMAHLDRWPRRYHPKAVQFQPLSIRTYRLSCTTRKSNFSVKVK